ncbi:cysteine desulfurase-like protein [Aeromonas piscicola]|uniref:cysteine desulfurase-like protein n=1 Tax=Aeromonas piscicola TaxID=600645 RepID=UPI0028E79EF3|nr:cysteine desulfurase-like protein [Aeromonas piscicola]
MQALDIAVLRGQFPALNQLVDGKTPIFFDGPGGAQVPRPVLTAMTDYLGHFNANLGGPFFSARATEQQAQRARQAVATLLGADRAEEIVFGANFTTLTFTVSRALSREWQAGDEIIVSALDHYSNVSSWQQAAADRGVVVHQVRVDVASGGLDYAHLLTLLGPKTRLVAVTAASNTTGTLVDIPRIADAVHGVGALLYVDAVHFAPHERIDVQAWDCDFLGCSAYKFFGPHLGILYGKHRHLERFTPYKVEPAKNVAPYKWETGTQNWEALAGVEATVEYLASLSGLDAAEHDLEARLDLAFARSRAHEQQLSAHLLVRLAERPWFTLHGINDSKGRTPTFAITSSRHTPTEMAEYLGQHQVCSWAGHFYALALVEQLGVSEGVLRVGCMHYNTQAEIDRLFALLDDMPY